MKSNLQFANHIIRELDDENAHIVVTSDYTYYKTNEIITETVITAAKTNYRNGVTKVETHLWGIKVYISRSDINNVGRLYEYGGILASLASGPIGAILSFMGLVMGDVPGGFSFNVTWPQVPTLPMLATNPLTIATIAATWKWQ